MTLPDTSTFDRPDLTPSGAENCLTPTGALSAEVAKKLIAYLVRTKTGFTSGEILGALDNVLVGKKIDAKAKKSLLEVINKPDIAEYIEQWAKHHKKKLLTVEWNPHVLWDADNNFTLKPLNEFLDAIETEEVEIEIKEEALSVVEEEPIVEEPLVIEGASLRAKKELIRATLGEERVNRFQAARKLTEEYRNAEKKANMQEKLLKLSFGKTKNGTVGFRLGSKYDFDRPGKLFGCEYASVEVMKKYIDTSRVSLCQDNEGVKKGKEYGASFENTDMVGRNASNLVLLTGAERCNFFARMSEIYSLVKRANEDGKILQIIMNIKDANLNRSGFWIGEEDHTDLPQTFAIDKYGKTSMSWVKETNYLPLRGYQDAI